MNTALTCQAKYSHHTNRSLRPKQTVSPQKLSNCTLTADEDDLVDWAELVTLDLSLFDTPGGKEKLAEQLTYAAHNVGFFYVKNFGISQEEVDNQFALGREFYDLPLEEKLKYHNLEDLRSGEYNGYRPAGLRQ